MSQRQNGLLITEDDVNDGNSCNGALLARVNRIIMKLFQCCCCFKWTLKNWLFWVLQSVFFWLPVDSVDVLMGFKVPTLSNFIISDEMGYSTRKQTTVQDFGHSMFFIFVFLKEINRLLLFRKDTLNWSKVIRFQISCSSELSIQRRILLNLAVSSKIVSSTPVFNFSYIFIHLCAFWDIA